MKFEKSFDYPTKHEPDCDICGESKDYYISQVFNEGDYESETNVFICSDCLKLMQNLFDVHVGKDTNEKIIDRDKAIKCLTEKINQIEHYYDEKIATLGERLSSQFNLLTSLKSQHEHLVSIIALRDSGLIIPLNKDERV